MKDLTQGPITGHLLAMAAPMAVGLIVQTLYYMVDLYFVARLGDAPLAGVSAAGNFTFVVLALTQMLGVGTVALIAHAAGAGDRPAASLAFNQSLSLAAACTLLTLAGGYALCGPYMRAVGADPGTVAAGTLYLQWYLPGLALQFALVATGSALRGTGVAKPSMVVQLATVVVNAALAPVLIAGVGTGHGFGVAGAGLASTIAVASGVVLMLVYFRRLEHYVGFRREEFAPRPAVWRRIVAIGLPAGGEFALMAAYMATIYYVIQPFGASAQAGFGVGSRVMQAIFLPAMAVAFAVAPVAGQNFGARRADRVRETFRQAALISAALMLVLALVARWEAATLIGFFTREPAVIAVGTTFLTFICWNFVGSGLTFVCSGLFQGLGNTLPSIVSSATRIATFILPALWIAQRPGFRIEHVWYLSVGTVAFQTLVSLALARRELLRRLAWPTGTPSGALPAASGAGP
jgi:putative MATE family efflux protein